MATNGGAQPAFGPDEVLQAMLTMRGGDSEKKKKAHEYLELFQKSVSTRSGPGPIIFFSIDRSLIANMIMTCT